MAEPIVGYALNLSYDDFYQFMKEYIETNVHQGYCAVALDEERNVVGYFWDIEKYPTSYIQVGQIVSKYLNYYFSSELLDYRIGLKLLTISFVIILVITLFVSINKRFKLVK